MITYNLKGKTALVTGAASGIGLATATLLAESGARVAINDLPGNPALDEVVGAMVDKNLDVIAAPGDAGDPDDGPRFVAQAINDLGSLNYLVNNAGTPGTPAPIPASDFAAQDETFWLKLLTVNLLGPYRCTVAASDALNASKGAIVNTASIAGIYGNGSSSVYAATKAALINQTREHARALGPNIRVNAIAPGIVESGWECRFNRKPETIEAVPLQRTGQPEDYAEVMVFLLAGAAYMTGEVVVVDGGLTAGPISPAP